MPNNRRAVNRAFSDMDAAALYFYAYDHPIDEAATAAERA